MKQHDDIEATCPECGYEVDDATLPSDPDARPTEGDIGVCLQCAGTAVYVRRDNGKLALRATTFEEKVQLSENEALSALREMVLAKAMWFTP